MEKRILDKSKNIFVNLPRYRDEVFTASIDVDMNVLVENQVIEKIARPFVAKKIKEYLGVEEDAMIKLVINHLTSSQNSSAESLLTKVEAILDDVADQFVVKLW